MFRLETLCWTFAIVSGTFDVSVVGSTSIFRRFVVIILTLFSPAFLLTTVGIEPTGLVVSVLA
jgi:hypothetical protein